MPYTNHRIKSLHPTADEILLLERQEELEEALFDCLKVIHMTNISKKSIADRARKVLGLSIGTRLPESYTPPASTH